MAGTLEDYKKQTYATADAQLNAAVKEKKKQDAATLEAATKVVDDSVAAQKKPYETKLAEAPGEYQAVFDRNALNEELGRQAVELRLANMGLTDSGLGASSQAALTTQRMNADAGARRSMQEYVHGLENAITAVEAEGTAKKTKLKLDADAAFNKWYNSTAAAVYKQADQDAATLYKQAEAARKAALKSTGQTAQNKTVTAPTSTQPPASGTVGTSPQPTDVNTAYQAVKAAVQPALDEVTTWNAAAGGIFNATFWSKPQGDGENVYEDIVEEQMEDRAAFQALSTDQQLIAIALAVGRSVAETWPKEKDNADNGTRIRAAMSKAQQKYGLSDRDYEDLCSFATDVYKLRFGNGGAA